MNDNRFGWLAGWFSVAAVIFAVAGFGIKQTPNPSWFPLLFFAIGGSAGAAAVISLLLWWLTERN